MDLSPRKKKAIDNANKIYEVNVAFALRGAEKPGGDAEAIKESIARYGSIRDRTIQAIKQPAGERVSNKPQHRVVGFEIKPKP